jgi:hypothetical protein
VFEGVFYEVIVVYIVPENCVFYVEVLLWSMTAIARFHFIAFEPT